ncbi:glycerate kinase [Aquibacillus kalidii]|uniref:glycerate kinase n=1 Tax=Aquibacillus kalidii TaxID=2762597 RepID=UPI0016466779|nr:glycerate kinase [Aquibacillus kalidii]
MKIVIAPDSFKGSISAEHVCHSVAEGIRHVLPEVNIASFPLADGGEGTLYSIIQATNGNLMHAHVTDPLGRTIIADYGILGDQETAFIEMAQASGYALLTNEERNPLMATSYGTGELIKHALDAGFRKFIIGLGGSATNDAGIGMLQALGVRFLTKQGDPIPEGVLGLNELATIDENSLDKRLLDSTFTIASDVTNVLCGPKGASAVFGPQKGATPEMVKKLDRALTQFAEVVTKQKGLDIKNIAGGGAAGGMGAGLIAFLHATVQSGINVIIEATGIDSVINGADLVITGEGKLDEQTLSGKVIAGITQISNKYRVPTIALCGGVNMELEHIKQLGLMAAFSIVPGPCSLQQAIDHAPSWITNRTEAIMSIVKQYHY